MERDRKSAGSSLYGEGDDMLISGGQTLNDTVDIVDETIEIVGEGKPDSSPVTVVREDSLSEHFGAANLLYWTQVENHGEGNYWLSAEAGEFVLDLGGLSGSLDLVELVNTYNGEYRNWAMKEFKVFLSGTSSAGPWEKVVHQTLADSRKRFV